jgi:hypothetical protein
MVKTWLFRRCVMENIGKIKPPSSRGHNYILVIMDYFTKWVEAILYRSIN